MEVTQLKKIVPGVSWKKMASDVSAHGYTTSKSCNCWQIFMLQCSSLKFQLNRRTTTTKICQTILQTNKEAYLVKTAWSLLLLHFYRNSEKWNKVKKHKRLHSSSMHSTKWGLCLKKSMLSAIHPLWKTVNLII